MVLMHMTVNVEPEKIAGASWTLNHRVDLHNALRAATLSRKGPGSVPVIRGGAKVVAVNCDTGTVTLEDGEVVQGDLIVGADGIHSRIREAVTGEKMIASPSGLSAYRCLLPRDTIKDIPEAIELLNSEFGYLKILITDKQERIIMYPCRDRTVLNIVAVCPDSECNFICLAYG